MPLKPTNIINKVGTPALGTAGVITAVMESAIKILAIVGMALKFNAGIVKNNPVIRART